MVWNDAHGYIDETIKIYQEMNTVLTEIWGMVKKTESQMERIYLKNGATIVKDKCNTVISICTTHTLYSHFFKCSL